MLNGKEMSLKLKRIDVCDLELAVLEVIFSLKAELRDENTNATRRKVIAEETLPKWRGLHSEIKKQLDAFDAEHADEI